MEPSNSHCLRAGTQNKHEKPIRSYQGNAHFVGFAQTISQLSRKVSASRLLRYGFFPKPPARMMSWVNGEYIVKTQRPFTYRYSVAGSKPFKNSRNHIRHGGNEKSLHLFSSRRASDAMSFIELESICTAPRDSHDASFNPQSVVIHMTRSHSHIVSVGRREEF